jgi:uncharacterized protein
MKNPVRSEIRAKSGHPRNAVAVVEKLICDYIRLSKKDQALVREVVARLARKDGMAEA